MSRSNLDKPFYVDVGTSTVAVRCASNHDVIMKYNHVRMPYAIDLLSTACDRMNREAEIGKPRRNCDKYKTKQSATRKWAEMTGASIYAEGDGNDWRKFFNWLYAPATEKEGGEK